MKLAEMLDALDQADEELWEVQGTLSHLTQENEYRAERERGNAIELRRNYIVKNILDRVREGVEKEGWS
jgi:ribosome-binding protein aMBF1 (putative translation factor)